MMLGGDTRQGGNDETKVTVSKKKRTETKEEEMMLRGDTMSTKWEQVAQRMNDRGPERLKKLKRRPLTEEKRRDHNKKWCTEEIGVSNGNSQLELKMRPVPCLRLVSS
jgi:hypothetical protein